MIFGGVTREGNRRARRAARWAVERGISVVWFDGYEEELEGQSGKRAPLGEANGNAEVVVVGYRDIERRHALLRVLDLPDGLERPYASDSSRVVGVLLRAASRSARFVRNKVLRRISLILRGVVNWRMIRADVINLASAAPPVRIVFGDDTSQTAAWHAARIWPEVPTGMEFGSQ